MTSRRRKHPPAKRARSAHTDDERVGYGHPPSQHRFKPGESGNPEGRRKGQKSEATILAELLHRKIAVNNSGKPRKITILEAILLRITEDSLRGNTKSAAFLLNRLTGEVDSPDGYAADLSVDDRSILATFAERIKRNPK